MANLEDFGLSSQEGFQQYLDSPESEYLENHPTARVEKLKREIQEANTDDVEEMMIIIMDVFKEEALYPEPGNFYTFVYQPKTPDITYDQHPLIACVGLFNWGFRGLNFHWQEYRNYTWAEVVGKLHVVYYPELDELLGLQYGKFLLNK
tara:strand:+ start:393 stop:839 length:447 start_codon:yes stop_codon:yes gene_type:complete